MKLYSWLLLTALPAICWAAVNGEQSNKQHSDLAAVEATKIQLLASTADSPAKASTADDFPIKLPATVDHPLQAAEARSLAASGFITKDGDIYELQTAASIGKIEARQVPDDDQHICKYGAVIIYSDVPCSDIKNIKVRDVPETPEMEAVPQENKLTEDDKEQSNENTLSNTTDSEQQKPNKRPIKPAQTHANRPTQNRPNKPNQVRPNKPNQIRPNKPNQSRPNKPPQNRPNKPAQNGFNKPPHKRPNKPGQNRPNKPGQNRPIQIVVIRPNKRPNNQKHPSNNNQITSRRVQPIYLGTWEDEYYDDDEDEDEDELYYQGYNTGYPAQYYGSEYDYDSDY